MGQHRLARAGFLLLSPEGHLEYTGAQQDRASRPEKHQEFGSEQKRT